MLIPARLVAALTPVRTAFVGSLVLSLLARASGMINRDGMLYVDAARLFLEGGFAAARQVFSWPFLSILMAAVAQLTGLGLENAGYLLNALFMAGACALLVASTSRQFPDAAWSICLVTLAIPGLNEYRNELLREYGCWFFIVLAFWLALRWSEKPRWLTALPVHFSLAAAALFRPEALALFPALVAWQLLAAPSGEKWRRLLMIGGPPLLGLMLLLALYLGGQIGHDNRLAGDLGRFNPGKFDAKARAFAATLDEYARDQARTILFFGSLALIPVKFINKIGIFIVPLLFLLVGRHARPAIARYPLFAWGLLAHLLVLAVFVTDLQFLAGRYVGLLYLLSAPFTGVGLWLLMQRYARWRWAMIAAAVLMMIANVVSLSPGKTQYVEAGAWLAAHAGESPRVYIESGRTAYYAGWRGIKEQPAKDRSALSEAVAQGKYDLLVLEVSRKEPAIEPWLESAGLQVVQRFVNVNRDAVLIVAPVAAQARSSVSNTERMR